jgi:Cu-Zn family superoxide dismutase
MKLGNDIIDKFYKYTGTNIFISVIIFILLIFILYYILDNIEGSHNNLRKAVVIVKHTDDKFKNIRGIVYFEELLNGSTKIKGRIKGLPEGYYGLHIHELGDLRNGCATLKGHYNPFKKNHGGRIKKDGKINYDRHVGDLGNIYSSPCGNAKFNFDDNLIKLKGEYSVMGRSIVIHKGKDDLGLGDNEDSKKTGNSGKRIACGLIGLM